MAQANGGKATAKVLKHEDKKTREERKAARAELFSKKAKYTGPTQKLTLHLREVEKGGACKVYAVLEKDDKKSKGSQFDCKTMAEALKKFDEVAEQCVAAGWTLAATASKSAFDAIPQAM